ncbi:MAG: riboflavin synthase, partial [Candidatus Bathyarchaeia archaeon]
ARVDRIEKRAENIQLYLDLGKLAQHTKIGDSVSLNGACLTIVQRSKAIACFETIAETLSRTNLGDLRVNDEVNVERSVRLQDRIGGHIVMGHVDGLGSILLKDNLKGSTKLWISAPPDILQFIVSKGSIALDGISFTVGEVEKERFSVYLIPHTLSVTNLGKKQSGELVNIEVDILGKYIKKFIDETISDRRQVT